MAVHNDTIEFVRVDPRGVEAEYWASQLRQTVQSIAPPLSTTRKRFPVPEDAIALVAKDTSRSAEDGQALAMGSVVIKRLSPGEEVSNGLPADVTFGEIKRMIVLPPYQGSGVAAKLLQAAEQAGKAELGLQCILIETLHTLPQAQKFYLKQGYKKRQALWGAYGEEDSIGFEKWL